MAKTTFANEIEINSENTNSNKMIKKVLGRKRDFTTADGEKHKAQYAIVELNDILATHNEVTFSKTIGYPTDKNGDTINDRDYEADKDAQKEVVDMAKDIDAQHFLSVTSTPSGTPIINEEGMVLSGNNITMSLKLAQKKYPSSYQSYQTHLVSDIDLFNMTQEDLAEFEHPVLVRIDYDAAIPTNERTEIERHYDKIAIEKEIAEEQHLADAGIWEWEQQIREQENQIIDLEIPAPPNKSLFFGGNWFKQNTDKILGEAYEASGRFGKVTKYKGTLELLSKINVPLDFIGNQHEINPLSSTVAEENLSALVTEPDIAKMVDDAANENADKRAKNKINKKLAKKEKPKVEDTVVQFSNENIEVQTFEEVFERYNSDEAKKNIETFVWWKSSIGKPLSRRWVNLITPNRFQSDLRETYDYSNDIPLTILNQWVVEGKLFYMDGKLEPSCVYLSGNIWEKQFALDRDANYIVNMYGQEVLDNQMERLKKTFQTKYNDRLQLTGDETGLNIKPFSKFASEFSIKRLDDMDDDKPFEVVQSKDGKLNWEKFFTASNRHMSTVEKLSIKDAFCYWLLKTRPDLKKPVTHENIIKYCVQQMTPITHKEGLDERNFKIAKARNELLKANCNKEGDRLFSYFLIDKLTTHDKVRLETEWNSTYNNHVPIDFNQVPVAFTMCKNYKDKFENLQAEKRDAVAFMLINTSGILSYDVGLGKTPSSIYTISAFMDAGYCKRPFICTPNQVYRQFVSEIRQFAPHIPINLAYNLRGDISENFKNADGNIVPVPEYSVTVMTYEGMQVIGFSEETQDELSNELYEILNQGIDGAADERNKQSMYQRIKTTLGGAKKGTIFQIEDFGFDFGCYDEAHAMKKIFTHVKGEQEYGGKRGRNPYALSSGEPSNEGLKGFVLNQYILRKNNYKNVMLLTATPFTNSPLEIFSMLSMVAYEQLKNTDLNNLKSFFDTYIATSYMLTIGANLKPCYKQVILGFNNLISLQSLIRKYILHKTGDQVPSIVKKRPIKYILPLRNVVVNGTILDIGEAEKIDTAITFTTEQAFLMDEIVSFVEGGANAPTESDLAIKALKEVADADAIEIDADAIKSEAEEIDMDAIDETQKLSVRTLKAMSWTRGLAISPYLYKYSGYGKPTYKKYIESSPKLEYVMKCIQSVREYHERKGMPVSGQIIYMDRGVHYFDLIKEYIVKELGYSEKEVGIIKSGLPEKGALSKENIKNLFNGEIYNENSGEMEAVDDEDRIKIIIGSSTIKEGMNLQKYGSVIYICSVDWNPTDMQQLTGRIWRQGNTFPAVRIVIPLMIDSSDIFIFQKLLEKSARLNSIWSLDNKTNVLNTEEFNPEEIKYALIRDPKKIAELRIIEDKNKFESEKFGISGLKEKFDRIYSNIKTVNKSFDEAIKVASMYRKFKSTGDKLADASKLVELINDVLKKQTDIDNAKMVYIYESRKPGEKYSNLKPLYKPHWFADFAIAVRDIKKADRDVFQPRNIPFAIDNLEPLKDYAANIDSDIARLDKIIKNYDSDEQKQVIINEIIEDRIKNKFEYKSVDTLVSEFSRLNNLLDKPVADAKIIEKIQAKITCPPTLPNETPDVSNEAIEQLSTCIATLEQTKKQNIDSEGNYTPYRKEIHKRIIESQFANVKCVESEKPLAIFTGGAPGSGKSTFLRKNADWVLSDDVFHLDADAIRAMLPEYKGWNANATQEETKDITDELLNIIGGPGCKYDLVYDGTMNKAKKYFPLIRKVKEMGYLTYIIFMDVPYSVSKERVIERYQRSGRFVPDVVINDFFEQLPNGLSRGVDSFNQLKELVDGYMVVDGVTGNIIEKGGIELPEHRQYSGHYTESIGDGEVIEEVFARPDYSDIVVDEQDVISDINPELELDEEISAEDRLENLRTALEFTDDEDERAEILEMIENIELTLELGV